MRVLFCKQVNLRLRRYIPFTLMCVEAGSTEMQKTKKLQVNLKRGGGKINALAPVTGKRQWRPARPWLMAN